MPTVHVTPGSDLLLQDIANALHKAKKVVVVTGAGISTNSGIPDFRSENGLYSLIQAQFDAASKELERRAEERDIASSPLLVEAVQERPSKRRKLSVQDEISVRSEPSCPDESSQTRETASQDTNDTNQQTESESGAQSTTRDEDQPMASIIVAGDGGPSIRVASQGISDVEESIVVLGNGAMDASESPDGAFRGAQTADSRPVRERRPVDSALRRPTAQTPNGSPRLLLPRQLEDDLSTAASPPDFGPSSESGPPTNISSSPRASTPRISHLSSEIDQPGSYPFVSSPLSSPPPILSDPYESSSLERTYSQSESISAASVSSSTDSEETDQTEEGSGSSTPYLTSQSSFNSSQSKATLPNLKGRDLFDASIWADPIKTSVFYTFATTLRQKARHVSPTTSHLFLSVLRDQRKLVRCYTQNIDRLEDRIGLSTSLELGAGSRARFSARAWRNSGLAGGEGKGPSPKGEAGGLARAGTDLAAEGSAHEKSHADPRGDGSEREEAEIEIRNGLGVLPGCGDGAGSGASRSSGAGRGSSSRSSGTGRSSAALEPLPGPASAIPRVPQAQPMGVPDPGGGHVRVPLHEQTTAPLPTAQIPTHSAPNRGVECVFLHGSLESLRCFLCGLTSSWDDKERELETLAGRQPTCPHCAGATAAREERGKRALGVGKLRPDIVLYGEEHPRSDLIGTIVQHDLSLGPDMLLILGTSLRVHGLKTVVREFAKAVHSKGGKVVFVNFTKPPDSVWSDVIDFWVQSDCDAWVLDIKTRKPALWLPPGTVLEDDEAKPSRSKRTSNGGSTSIRRESSGLSLSSEKESGKTGKVKRKSNGDATKLQRKDSGLSTVLESINVSETSTSNNTSIDISPSVPWITDGTTAERSITIERSAGFRGRRPPHSVHIRQVFASMEASKQAHGPSPLETAKVEEGNETNNPKKVTAKRSRKSLPTAAGLRPAPPREFKLNPNAKRPQAIRDEVQNAAYLSWKILEDLKRLTGQPKPSFIYTTPPPPAPKVPRVRKSRKSAPAALSSEPTPLPLPLPSEMVTPLTLEEAPLPLIPLAPQHLGATVLPFDPACTPLAATCEHQDTQPVLQLPPAMYLPLVERSIPHPLPTMLSAFDEASEKQEVTAGNLEHPPQVPDEQPKMKRGKTTKPKEKKVTIPGPSEVETQLPQQPSPLESTSSVPVVSPGSIGAAIKRNPRKRKRKTIDGVEVVLPNEGRRFAASARAPRSSLPLSSPRPQTPLLQIRDAPPESHPPQTPHIILPLPRPSVTPVTPRFSVAMELQRVQDGLEGLEHGTLHLPRMHNETPPKIAGGARRLDPMEPEPTVGPLPVRSHGQHKLADFFVSHGGRHHQIELESAPFGGSSPGLDNPFFLHNPLVALPYQSRPASIVPSRAGSPDPSEQLKSEQRSSDEEAALTLSMFRHGVSQAVAEEYLADRRQVQHGRGRYGNLAAEARYLKGRQAGCETAWLVDDLV